MNGTKSGMKATVLTSLAVLICLWVLPVAGAELVYIPLGSANQIIVVAPEEDRIVDKIEHLPAVHGLAATPDGRFLIAGSYDEREPGENAPARPTGMSEDEHAAHHARPSVDAAGTDSAVSTVSVVSIAEGAVVRRIDVPGAVHHVAISPGGSVAVVTHPNQDTISVIDLRSYKVLVTIPTGPLPNFAVFSPDGRRVYVSNAGNDTVSMLDTASWQAVGNIAVGSSPEHLVLSDDGTNLFVNNVGDGSVSVVEFPLGKATHTISVGDTLHGIDLSEDGQTLFVSAMGEDKLMAIDLVTGQKRSTTLGPSPYHLAVVRGTSKLYVSSAEEPKLWVVDQDSLTVAGEISIGGKGHQMVQFTGP